jgi:ABC-type antimicrobial peptide transport system permease subunit
MRNKNKKQSFLASLISYLKLFIELTALILGYLVYQLINVGLKLIPGKLSNRFATFSANSYQKLVDKLDRPKNHSISRLSLIKLSTQNLASKKSRTLITIGGMAVGIGSIVFLVSIGYGLQDLVVSRVARLEELKQTDVIAQPNSELKINDESLSNFNNLSEVEQVLPLISVVGRVTYKQAVSDMAVYGVTSSYLETSAIQPIRGEIFESDDLARLVFEKVEVSGENLILGEVAGAQITQADFGQSVGEVQVDIEPHIWLRVRESPNTNSEILGYTKRPEGQLFGEKVYGSAFSGSEAGNVAQTSEGQDLGYWIQTSVFVWQKDEFGEYQPVVGEQGEQLQKTGYIAELGLTATPKLQAQAVGSVLGVTDEQNTATNPASVSQQTVNITDSGIDWVELATDSAQLDQESVQQVVLSDSAQRQAVVNRAMLNVLGLAENQALGEKFEASFIVMGKALGQAGEKVESVPSEYDIVGIIPGDKTPLFYVPFLDLRSLGIVNYQQAKLVTSSQQVLPEARQKIEAMGYVTRSVVDTVDQIESIFATTRLLLALLGLAALLVASLGMFNTLTVSLLERTREVGLMKALGMKSHEVKELFLIESLTMGLLGGVLGLLLGFLSGKLLSIGLSVFSIARGVGVMDISLIPVGFVVVIIFLAILVGIITGLYPAKRARHISALNALRYE